MRALTAMPQGQFELAVGLVMAHHPGLQSYDDVGFDLDALDALTLRQMQVGLARGQGTVGGTGASGALLRRRAAQRRAAQGGGRVL